MACIDCNGIAVQKITSYNTYNLDNKELIIYHVPALVCNTCGKMYLKGKMLERIQELEKTYDAKVMFSLE